MGPVVHLKDAASFRACCGAENAGERFIVVDFTASWCGPCKMIAPHVEAIASEYDSSVVTVAKVDVDENREVAAHYNISSMPTFLFFRHGEVLFQFGGADPGKLRSSLSGLMGSAFDKYAYGTSVSGRGLKSAKQYNGALGKVQRFDWKTSRYAVKFENSESAVSLRPQNLTPVVECELLDEGGTRATLAGVSEDGTKYLVKGKENDTLVSVAPHLVILPSGTVALIQGLVGAAQYNGKFGKIESYDGARYSIQIRVNKRIKVKPANVHACSLG